MLGVFSFKRHKILAEFKKCTGLEIPSGTPLGIPTADYSSDITQTFVDNWENYGGEECNGFDWWFSGNISMPDDSGGITSESSGLKQEDLIGLELHMLRGQFRSNLFLMKQKTIT